MGAMQAHKSLVVVVGATGTRKSKLAVDLAQRFNGEVINGDAMQLYEGLPVITNKIPPEERKGIPHHLLGCVTLQEDAWNVGNFVERASATIGDIQSRGRLPVLVGGTHYYLQALLFPGSLTASEESRAKFTQSQQSQKWPILEASTPAMLEELRRIDPAMAGRWHPNDRRKIRRSLEIYLQSGKRASDIYAEQGCDRMAHHDGTEQGESAHGVDSAMHHALRSPVIFLWTHTSRDVLVKRLDRRVHQMVEDGLLEEVRSLDVARKSHTDNNFDHSKGVWTSIGYKEFRDYSTAVREVQTSQEDADQLLKDAIEQVQSATRQYARSQLKWIRTKLANALRRAGAQNSMYLIDTTCIDSWESSVLDPAADLVRKFLSGEAIPDPLQHSVIACEMLQPKQEYDLSKRQDLWKSQLCSICDVTAVTEQQWQQHLNSRRHRNTVKALKKHEQHTSSLPGVHE